MEKQKPLVGRVQFVPISDMHAGSSIGISPKKWLIHDGKDTREVYQSSTQEFIYGHWLSSWERRFSRKLPIVVLDNGDNIDGDHHGNTQNWSLDPLEQSSVLIDVLNPIRKNKLIKRWYATRGTSAHVGQKGKWDEYIAKELGVDVPDGGMSFSSYILEVEVSGVLINAMHHGPKPGRRLHTFGNRVRDYAYDIVIYRLSRGQRPPDLIVRSHVHTAIHETIRVGGHQCDIIITPAWMAMTEFFHKIITERDVADIGMAYIDLEDGKVLDVNFDKVEFDEIRRAKA